ncbi:MAG: prephenate dehydrogenase [Bacteroidota bacterium]
MKTLVIGTGLIGGSFALSLSRSPSDYQLGGWDDNPQHLQEALEANLVAKTFSSMEEGIRWAEAIILAVPISAITELLPSLLDCMTEEQFVVDFGSTKSSICSSVRQHKLRHRYLAAHPIAGTEYSGPRAAFATLYESKVMIVCEAEQADAEVLQSFEKMCALSKMKMVYMEADEHDRHLAYISHLSHVVAYSLSHVVLQKEKDGDVILELAGSGLASTVRLAKSSPEMWTPIFLDNKRPLMDGVGELQRSLTRLNDLIRDHDEAAVFEFLKEGRKIRKILE